MINFVAKQGASYGQTLGIVGRYSMKVLAQSQLTIPEYEFPHLPQQIVVAIIYVLTIKDDPNFNKLLLISSYLCVFIMSIAY